MGRNHYFATANGITQHSKLIVHAANQSRLTSQWKLLFSLMSTLHNKKNIVKGNSTGKRPQ